LLLTRALVRFRDEGPEALSGQVGHRVRREITLDNAGAGVGGAPPSNQLFRQLARLAVFRINARVQLQQRFHGVPLSMG
jgi:hypothetical protein